MLWGAFNVKVGRGGGARLTELFSGRKDAGKEKGGKRSARGCKSSENPFGFFRKACVTAIWQRGPLALFAVA